MLALIIDGQSITVPPESTVLQAIRSADVYLPTLCYWEGLPPYGACRLCLVEMIAPRQQVIAACAHPVEDGMVVDTQGKRAVAIRKMMLEFMLARCPTSDAIQSLAAEAGVTSTRFISDAGPNELCILCGLCVRVCRDPSARQRSASSDVGSIGKSDRHFACKQRRALAAVRAPPSAPLARSRSKMWTGSAYCTPGIRACR
jgi:NADH dehydrogenase/NADH:ubiquinone oxidoreductase subunit G